MKFDLTQEIAPGRSLVPFMVIGGCVLAGVLVFTVFMNDPAPVPEPARHATTRKDAPAPPAPAPMIASPESRVTFASRMPSGRGTSVVATTGDYIGAAVQVAVPRKTGGYEFVPGNDPRAVEYLAAQRAAQEAMTFDSGSDDVDLSAATMKNSVSSRGRMFPLKRLPK